MSEPILSAFHKVTKEKEYWTGFAYEKPGDILRQWKTMEPNFRDFFRVSITIAYTDDEAGVLK